MPRPKLTYRGTTYTYHVKNGKVVNSVVEHNLQSIIEEELSGYGGIDQKEMDAINEMIFKELEHYDIPWDEIDSEAYMEVFG